MTTESIIIEFLKPSSNFRKEGDILVNLIDRLRSVLGPWVYSATVTWCRWTTKGRERHMAIVWVVERGGADWWIHVEVRRVGSWVRCCHAIIGD